MGVSAVAGARRRSARTTVNPGWWAGAVGVLGAATCALSLAAPALAGLPLHPGPQIVHVVVSASYVGAAVVAIVRRPANLTGPLMAAVGLLWLVPDLAWIPAALPFTLATTYPQLYQAVLAHLALAFPSGRLPGRRERWMIGALYAWTLVNNPVVAMFDDPSVDGCRCQRNLFLVDSDASAHRALSAATTVVSIGLALVVITFIVRHWQRATHTARYVMEPVLWLVLPAGLFVAVQQVGDLWTLSPTGQLVVDGYLPLGLASLPIGFLVGLLRTRLAYAHVGALAAEMDGRVQPGKVREVLARMLHDPEVELLYWSPSMSGYVDIDGNPREPAHAVPGRTTTRIDGERGPVAMVTVDDAALHEPGLLRAAESMTRLALENERLHAEVRSQLVQLRQVSERLVDAGQEARRRLERDLHDGAQQRLLSLSMTLGRARARLEAPPGMEGQPGSDMRAVLEQAGDELQQAIAELRELARGIHPALLTSEGLGPALQALAERAALPVQVTAPVGRRFTESVESTAYFLVSEAVTNAARHSGAHRVSVSLTVQGVDLVMEVTDDGVGGVDARALRAGSGLQGMHDRVTALGGSLVVVSPRGAGTRITARLPCG